MMKTEALKLALEALERYVNEDEIIEKMQGNEPWVETKRMGEKAITSIKAALANEALERMAENARELGLDYESVQKVTLGRNEALRVTAEGEFIWHPEAYAMIEHGDFTSNPAMRFILKELRKRQQPAALEAKDEPVAFKIYKPTPPRGAIPNVRDVELPWVYDQDPSSGNVASMWVTPVQTLRSKK